MNQQPTENIWGPGRIIVIPTNGDIKSDNTATMGAGLARQAKHKYPQMPKMLGQALRQWGNHVFYFKQFGIYTFPTKHHWDEDSDLALIENSAKELLQHVKTKMPPDVVVWVPMVGCGLGNLSWINQVKPLLLRVWADNLHNFRFVEE